MPARSFSAPDGRTWQAWNVNPKHTDWPTPTRLPLPESMAEGWLCFEADDDEKRRLRPVPPGWESGSEEELWSYCCLAEPVRRRHLI